MLNTNLNILHYALKTPVLSYNFTMQIYSFLQNFQAVY